MMNIFHFFIMPLNTLNNSLTAVIRLASIWQQVDDFSWIQIYRRYW
jgi:hypothetical protein